MNAEKLIANSLGSIISILIIGAAAQVSIPLPESISVAPITGQSLAILMVACILKWQWGGLSVLLYCLIGGLGAPIFADFKGGFDVLTGPTMGYFIGFLLATLAIGYLATIQKSRFPFYLLQMLLGTLIILLVGWLGLLQFLDTKQAFLKGVLPFLPGALAKIFLGAILLSVYRRFKSIMNAKSIQ